MTYSQSLSDAQLFVAQTFLSNIEGGKIAVYPQGDVKDFIKKLKKGFLKSIKTMTFDEYVDKLAGDKLK